MVTVNRAVADRTDMEESTAFVPGHVTGFFSSHPAENPLAAGSRGAGVTLSDGVTVTVRPGEGVTLDGNRTTVEPVEAVCAELDVDARVTVESSLPVGSGFGVSGAAALGTALAANARFDRGRSENELVGIAHAAEVAAGTGLGDVVAQARGGVPIRLEPGAPGYGCLDAVPANARVEYLSFGELSTADVLAGDTDGLSDAGERALTALVEDPRLPTLMATSRRFARDADLLVTEVAEAIAAVEAAGGRAAMAMLGRTVFALGTGLSDAGYEPDVCRIDPAGARLVDGE